MEGRGGHRPIRVSKRPESVLVIVHTEDRQVLLLRRVGHEGFWQSVTGSLEAGESPAEAAAREVHEETGLPAAAEALHDWRLRNRFVIPPKWRARYAPGVRHNCEHVFSICLAAPYSIRVSAHEHSEARWTRPDEALGLVWSWTNRDAIRLLLAGPEGHR